MYSMSANLDLVFTLFVKLHKLLKKSNNRNDTDMLTSLISYVFILGWIAYEQIYIKYIANI